MKNEYTISQVVKDGLCHGCGTCISLCPNSAIELKINERKGVYYPSIDIDKCTSCGVCYKVCPGHSVDFKGLNQTIFGKQPDNHLLGNYLNCYTGFSNDSDIRFSSSSGGIVSTLLIHALQKGLIDGALVTRMNEHNPLLPEPFIARTEEEILKAGGSKYCPVPANIAIKTILENKGRYAVVGLPCHIQGIRKAEEINKVLREKISLHIGIFCANSVSFHGTEYILKKAKIEKSDVLTISYRGDGWPGYLKMKLKRKNDIYKIEYGIYSDNYFLAFAPWRCKVCIDHTAELTDISCGDAWLPEFTKTCNAGTSVIICRTYQGINLIKNILDSNKIHLDNTSAIKIVESQGGIQSKKRIVGVRMKFAHILAQKRPIYGQIIFQYKKIDILIAINDFIKFYLSDNKQMWWLLRIYCIILKLGFMKKIFQKVLK
jgi:coenzyme F420 hydrogenase subunit beta